MRSPVNGPHEQHRDHHSPLSDREELDLPLPVDEDPFDFVPAPVQLPADSSPAAPSPRPEETGTPEALPLPQSEFPPPTTEITPAPPLGPPGPTEAPESALPSPLYQRLSRQQGTHYSTHGSATLMVALALVLLVFFVVLISISKADQQRKAAVLDSLRKTFLLAPASPPDLSSLKQELTLTPVELYQQQITELLTKELPSPKLRQNTYGSTLVANIPSELLFLPSTADLRPARNKFIDGLAALLINAPPGVTFKVEIVVGTNYDSSKIEERIEPMARSRAATLAVAMMERNSPAATFAIGAVSGKAETVRMTFTAIDREPSGTAKPLQHGTGSEAGGDKTTGAAPAEGGKAK